MPSEKITEKHALNQLLPGSGFFNFLPMIKILQELKELIPPLSTDEKAQLESNCINEGIRDPLVLAEYPDENAEVQTVLADGHNRYVIAQDNDLPYKTVTKEFESLNAVKLWMIDNQKGRRNLSDWVKLELAQVKRDILAAKGREKMIESKIGNSNAAKTSLSIIDKDVFQEPKHNTREEIAKDLGWSTGKVAMADKVRKHIETNQDQELRDKLRKNEVSINQAYQELKEKEREAKIAERQQLIEAKKAEPIKSNKEWFVNGDSREETKKAPNGIKLIFTDPPYGMDFQSNRRVQSPKAMKIQGDGNIADAINLFEEVMVNLVPKMQNDSAALVWCSFRDERYFADSLIKLGLEIKNSIIWVRPNHGTGDLEGSFAPKHDRLLFAVKGRPKLIPRLPDVLDGSTFLKTEHPTKKPIDLIEKVINSLTMPGDLVVDPFAGSCSVGVPCVKTGREFWGCELEKLHWVEGQKNLNNI
jgi:site-specific DNA-methyltransferase (adenine-specific)